MACISFKWEGISGMWNSFEKWGLETKKIEFKRGLWKEISREPSVIESDATHDDERYEDLYWVAWGLRIWKIKDFSGFGESVLWRKIRIQALKSEISENIDETVMWVGSLTLQGFPLPYDIWFREMWISKKIGKFFFRKDNAEGQSDESEKIKKKSKYLENQAWLNQMQLTITLYVFICCETPKFKTFWSWLNQPCLKRKFEPRFWRVISQEISTRHS